MVKKVTSTRFRDQKSRTIKRLPCRFRFTRQLGPKHLLCQRCCIALALRRRISWPLTFCDLLSICNNDVPKRGQCCISMCSSLPNRHEPQCFLTQRVCTEFHSQISVSHASKNSSGRNSCVFSSSICSACPEIGQTAGQIPVKRWMRPVKPRVLEFLRVSSRVQEVHKLPSCTEAPCPCLSCLSRPYFIK